MSNETQAGSQEEWIQNNYELYGGDGYNAYIDEFGYRFGRLATHFENRIYYWEIWNEPNCWADNPDPGIYLGCSFIYPSNFAALLTHVHSQAHYYSNLNVYIISGGLLSHDFNGMDWEDSGAAYLNDTFNMGVNITGKFAWTKETYGSYPLDALGQHIYIDQLWYVNRERLSDYLDYMQMILAGYGEGDKATWITEFGWQTSQVDELIQGTNIITSLEEMQDKGYIAAGIYFQLDDTPSEYMYWGLFNEWGIAKEAFYAFKDFQNFF
jgi:hypothetical protein